jgi:Homeodomain-like domain
MAIRYAVDLPDTARAALRESISKNKATRSTIMNAYVLLKAARTCGWPTADMASAYAVSTKKVEQLKKRFVAAGVAAAWYRKPVTTAHRRNITGDAAAHWIALYCRQAPAGHERWTLRRLADKMVALDSVDAVSHETGRRPLQKPPVTPGKRTKGVCRQSQMPPGSARGKTS